MPTYDYECTNCGRVFEMLQNITAKPKRMPAEPCGECGERAPIRRLIGAGGAVLFKGSGFYETDYRSESYKKAAKADKDKQATTGDKSTGKKSGSDKDSSTPSGTTSSKDSGKPSKS